MQYPKYGYIPAVGEEVRVYRNLHHKCWSVQAKVWTDAGRQEWRVVFHANAVVLEDARFQVNEAGRQKVLRERKKNVHAFVAGKLRYLSHPWNAGDTNYFRQPVTYNPYKAPTFVEASTSPPVPVLQAPAAWLTDDGTSRVWCVPAELGDDYRNRP